ncbi:type I restriction endonuclease subunit S [Kosakonia radicincitans]|uniref:restriction endonuclease subunit S n=1 Tax=Kosakonia radicincitans TaxID=283686 RepID=UPI0011F05F04|nr:restriction endonuclease subunit S [Kosakonia radicincitans]QEM93363.1 type I restriction endonuclease subunit S [Kosakonia radicincitans]
MSAGKLPEGWAETQLGNVVEYGKVAKRTLSDVKQETWVLELEDIEKDSSKLLGKTRAHQRPFKSTKNSFQKGDVLYGKLRPYLNKIIVADEDGVCTTEIVPINAEPFCFNKYIFYWLKSSSFLHYVDEVSYGVNMPRLGTADGLKAPLRLAPLAEQKIIAEKLDTLLAQVDSTKARLEQIPKILKRFRQAVLAAATSGGLTQDWRKNNELTEIAEDLLKRWMVEREGNVNQQYLLLENDKVRRNKKTIRSFPPDLVTGTIPTIPDSWKIVSISQFADCLDSQRIPVKKENRMVSEGKYPYFGANGEVDRVDEYIFDGDYVLVTEDETFYGRVKPIAYRYTGKCWVNNHVHILSAPTKIANDYLSYALMYYRIIPWLTGTTGRAKLTQGALNVLPIGLPPENEMIEIVRRVEQLFAYADTIEKQVNAALARVNNLTQSILAKAFRGELTAQWRAENPDLISGENSAAALLEKINVNNG